MREVTGKDIRNAVVREVSSSLEHIPEEAIDRLSKRLDMEKRIFCDAAGRSRLQVEGFAMRLIQMGFRAHIVGEPTTPAIASGDVLLVCSASGETQSLVEHARKAHGMGTEVLLITAGEESSLGGLCDYKIIIEAPSKQEKTAGSVQPMGSLFEQSAGILFDIVVMYLMEHYGITSDAMYRNHSNLE